MEVLIRVEVSTDTADPKITRQEVQRAWREGAIKRQRVAENVHDLCNFFFTT